MKNLLNLFSLKLIASILGLVSSIITVRLFGASRVIEIYFVAQTLVYLVASLTQSGQLAEVFLPEFHRLKEVSEKLGFAGLNVVINRFFLWSITITVLIFLSAPLFMKFTVPGYNLAEQEQAVLIFRILLPYLLLQFFNSFFITVLNAEKKYGRAELLGLTNISINIILLILFYKSLGIWALVISALTGKLLEFIFYIIQLYKIGYKYEFIFSVKEFNHLSFFSTMKATLFYVSASQIYTMILTASISFLPEGVFAVFKYVRTLGNKVDSVFLQPFIILFFTQYSLLVQKRKAVNKKFTKNFNSIINVNIIVLIGTILIGDIIIDLIWGGKKFDIDDVKLAYVFLIICVITVFISSIGSIYRKMSVTHGKAKKLYFYWSFSQLLSAAFTYILIKHLNVVGICIIIPLNAFLIAISSYYVFSQIKKLYYNSFINHALGLLLIVSASMIKYFGEFYIKPLFTEEYLIAIFALSTLLLSLYPALYIYRLMRINKD